MSTLSCKMDVQCRFHHMHLHPIPVSFLFFFQYQSFCLYGQYRTCHFPFGLRWTACVQGKLSVRKSSLIFTTDLTCKIITISNTLGALVILSGLHSILSLTIKKSLFILSRTCQQHAEYTKPLIKCGRIIESLRKTSCKNPQAQNII